MSTLLSIKKGPQSGYDALVKDDNTIYFTTDTHRLYIGNIEYTNDNNIIEVLSQDNNIVFIKKDGSKEYLPGFQTAIWDESGNAIQQVYSALIPYGTQIGSGEDLNSIDFVKVGNYYCSKHATAAKVINSPTTRAFMMRVYSPLSTGINNETGTWKYRLRKIITCEGDEYVQAANTDGTAGHWIFKDWIKITTAKDLATQMSEIENLIDTKLGVIENGSY